MQNISIVMHMYSIIIIHVHANNYTNLVQVIIRLEQWYMHVPHQLSGSILLANIFLVLVKSLTFNSEYMYMHIITTRFSAYV